MADWVIEPLNRSHEREAFSCGNASLDHFLKTLASQYEKKHIGRTFVATRSGEKRVFGYYTSAAGSFALNALPESARKKLPKHSLPTIHLGRLAVDISCQGQRLGEMLLFHFLHAAMKASEGMGVFAADVLAIDENACRFYLKYGFLPLEDNPQHFYLSIATIEGMFDFEK
jgi:ribosomal protein S18 acetylase RimI-like enzyme